MMHGQFMICTDLLSVTSCSNELDNRDVTAKAYNVTEDAVTTHNEGVLLGQSGTSR